MPLYEKTSEYHKTGTRYQRFNKKAALLITENVGTMTCCWLFCLIALTSLPATLVAAHIVPSSTFDIAGLYIATAGLVGLVAWTAQAFLQLTLLPAIIVGQNLANEASDARSAKTFEDVETIKDLLNAETEGGIKAVVDAVQNRKEGIPYA